MDKTNTRYMGVREEIAMLIFQKTNAIATHTVWEMADQILSIEGIAILDEDQSLPKIDKFKGEIKRILNQANFKKVIK